MNSKIISVVLILITTIFVLSFRINDNSYDPSASFLESEFKSNLIRLISKVSSLEAAVKNDSDVTVVKEKFKASRFAYKESEWLLEYYYPSLCKKLNGPALPYLQNNESRKVIEPSGFQLIESFIYPEYNPASKELLLSAIHLLKIEFDVLANKKTPYGFLMPNIFDAMRLQSFRIIALGITGFDSPSAQISIEECVAALSGIKKSAKIIIQENKGLKEYYTFTNALNKAIIYLKGHDDFNSFNRLAFITDYANPLSRSILKLQKRLSQITPNERRLLSNNAPDLFSMPYYNIFAYSNNINDENIVSKIFLGEKLFYDNILSSGNNRSCATCHQPSRAFTDGLAKATTLHKGITTQRNTPTLINAGLQTDFFHDGRAESLERQIKEVIQNEMEMNGSFSEIVKTIQKDTGYVNLFYSAYNTNDGNVVSSYNISHAIASYIRSLSLFNSAVDKYIQGDKTQLTPTQKNGFNLFTGKAKCATCHFLPLYNGLRPPGFNESEFEVIGVPENNDTVNAILDKDMGRFDFIPVSVFQFSFKTPTLRNVALTSPYMHNGVFNTLEEVVEFYNKGGATGLHIQPVSQTLPFEKLELSEYEKKCLVEFMGALTDTVTNIQKFNPKNLKLK